MTHNEWRFQIVVWNDIMAKTTSCGLQDDYLLKVRVADQRKLVNALNSASAEIDRLNELVKELDKKTCSLYTTNGLPCEHMTD